MEDPTVILHWGTNVQLSLPSCSGAPIVSPWLLAAFLFLPLRYFLNMAHLRRRMWGAVAQEDAFPHVTTHLSELALFHLRQSPPHLLISHETRLRACTFGTFRRQYLVLSHSLAGMLEEWFASQEPSCTVQGEALLLHELAHMAQRDIWLVLGLYSLFRAAILILGLEFGFGLFLLMLGARWNEFLGAHTGGAVLLTSRAASGLFSVSGDCATQPLALVLYSLATAGGVLLLMSLCCACSKSRELAADRRVVRWQGSAKPLREALLVYSVYDAVQPREAVRTNCKTVWGNWRGRYRGWFSFHPSLDTRLAQLCTKDRSADADLKQR